MTTTDQAYSLDLDSHDYLEGTAQLQVEPEPLGQLLHGDTAAQADRDDPDLARLEEGAGDLEPRQPQLGGDLHLRPAVEVVAPADEHQPAPLVRRQRPLGAHAVRPAGSPTWTRRALTCMPAFVWRRHVGAIVAPGPSTGNAERCGELRLVGGRRPGSACVRVERQRPPSASPRLDGLVRPVSEGGLEPPRPIRALAPQASASANSATRTSGCAVRVQDPLGNAGKDITICGASRTRRGPARRCRTSPRRHRGDRVSRSRGACRRSSRAACPAA